MKMWFHNTNSYSRVPSDEGKQSPSTVDQGKSYARNAIFVIACFVLGMLGFLVAQKASHLVHENDSLQCMCYSNIKT